MNGKLKKLREEAGMTQTELAQRVGVDRSYINKIENKNIKPSLALLERIAATFNISVKDFF